jgi:hypothetical protein
MPVVSDDSLALELIADALLLISDVRLAHDLVDPRQARLVRNELVDTVNNDRQTGGVVVSSGSETWASLKS